MTPDQLRAEQAKCLRVLRDIFLPVTQQDADYTGGTLTKDGIAYPLNVQSDADAITALVGSETY